MTCYYVQDILLLMVRNCNYMDRLYYGENHCRGFLKRMKKFATDINVIHKIRVLSVLFGLF